MRLPGLVVLALCLSLAGCTDETPSKADVDSGPAAPAVAETKLVEALYYGFLIDSKDGSGTIDLEIPSGSLSTYLSIVYLNGAYHNAAFTLGECQDVTAYNGTAVTAGGLVDAGNGQQDRTALHECGDVPDGPQVISWKIEAGALYGRLMVYVEVPA